MIDENLNISDEMLAAYIDGNSNPLEEKIVSESFSNESVTEVLELSTDCKDSELLTNFEALDFSSVVDDFTKPLRDYNELKNNIDFTDDTHIM